MQTKLNLGRRINAPAPVYETKSLSDSPAFPDEIEHLAEINGKLDEAIGQAKASVAHLDDEYTDTKHYMAQNRGEIDPHEMFRNEQELNRIDQRGALAVKTRDKLFRLKDSPYFARIDFHEAGEEKPLSFYIGQFAFHYDDELLVSDWRSPVAGMFYDCEVGAAGYDAPIGRIEGELKRKRQFKIKNGKMVYALESSMNVQDDILQRELSHTSDEKMKSIIATIQKEQNRIIRNENAGTLMIQGVAGSGKTSIALHRIAYLLYRFKDNLTAKNIAILSPNRVFGDYISNVLPELGEEEIGGISFQDIAEIQLEGVIGFAPACDPLETNDPKWAARTRHKSTLGFVKLMDEYLTQMPENVFEARDYSNGSFLVEQEWIQNRFVSLSSQPVKKRLQAIASDIQGRFRTDSLAEYTPPTAKAIIKCLTTMLRVKDTLALYKDYFKQMNMADKFVMPAANTLEWEDVYPFLYFHSAFEGLKESRGIKHIVIDEMQDYTPAEFKVINILFSCRKTILGDFGQSINPNHKHSLGDLRELYDDAQLIELNKSYRSTYEIITFAKRIQNVTALEAVERHGDVPKLISCTNVREELEWIKSLISEFAKSKNITLGIILKTNSAARALYDALSRSNEVNMISPDCTTFANGVSVTSIQMSKGLEFDEVIIPSANTDTYSCESDRGLLYVACTRAMHRLYLTYTGEVTPLIG